MTGQQLLNQIYYAYKGKDTSRHPAWGTAKATTAIDIANRKQREWATDPRNKWNSLFEIRAITPVIDALTTPTTTYDLASDFFAPSDYVRIVKTDGSVYEYPITQAQKRNTYDQALYIHGSNPKKATFAQMMGFQELAQFEAQAGGDPQHVVKAKTDIMKEQMKTGMPQNGGG